MTKTKSKLDENMNNDIIEELNPKVTIIGVGGAGGNALKNMKNSGLVGVNFLVANTDQQAIVQSKIKSHIRLGKKSTKGLGAGSLPSVGKKAAEESVDELIEAIGDTDMLFIAAGMGGGTGTGASPVIAKLAKERDILTVAVVTTPFEFEGTKRKNIALEGIKELEKYVDTLLVLPNQNLFNLVNEKTSLKDAFSLADNVLYNAVRSVTDLMMCPGIINLDFADVRVIMRNMGYALMGTGEASGEDRAYNSAMSAINNPLLGNVSINNASGLLVNITGGADITLIEVERATSVIRDQINSEANIIVGASYDKELNGKFRVSVVATGLASFNEDENDKFDFTELSKDNNDIEEFLAKDDYSHKNQKSETLKTQRFANVDDEFIDHSYSNKSYENPVNKIHEDIKSRIKKHVGHENEHNQSHLNHVRRENPFVQNSAYQASAHTENRTNRNNYSDIPRPSDTHANKRNLHNQQNIIYDNDENKSDSWIFNDANYPKNNYYHSNYTQSQNNMQERYEKPTISNNMQKQNAQKPGILQGLKSKLMGIVGASIGASEENNNYYKDDNNRFKTSEKIDDGKFEEEKINELDYILEKASEQYEYELFNSENQKTNRGKKLQRETHEQEELPAFLRSRNS